MTDETVEVDEETIEPVDQAETPKRSRLSSLRERVDLRRAKRDDDASDEDVGDGSESRLSRRAIGSRIGPMGYGGAPVAAAAVMLAIGIACVVIGAPIALATRNSHHHHMKTTQAVVHVVTHTVTVTKTGPTTTVTKQPTKTKAKAHKPTSTKTKAKTTAKPKKSSTVKHR